MISKKFIQSSLIYTLAGALPMASGIILLPFYGKLPVQVFGALSIYFSFSLLVQILVTYSFDASLYINYHEFKSDPQKLSSFISSAFVLILLISLATGLVLALIGHWIFSLVFTNEEILFYPYGLLSAATGIFQSLQKVNNSLLQTQQKPTLYFWFNLLSFAFIAGFTIVGISFFPGNLWGPIGGKLFATGITAIWVLVYIGRQFGFHFNWQLLKTTFSFNNNSLVYQVLQWFINYFDRPFILLFLPLDILGVYDLSLKLMMAIEFVLVGLNATIVPKVLGIIVAQKQKGSTLEINRYYHGLTAVVMLLVSAGIFSFPYVTEWFFVKPGYRLAAQLIPYVAVMYLFRSMRLYIVNAYSGLKHNKVLPVFYLVVLVIKMGLMYLLIGHYGIYGVIASAWLSYLLEVVLLYFGIRKRFAFKINYAKMIVAPIALALLILLLEPLLGAAYGVLLHGFYCVFTVSILFLAYRNEIKTISLGMVK